MAESISRDIKRSLSDQTSVSLVVDLKEVFSVPFFPDDDRLRQAIGQEIIDMITARAKDSNFFSGSSAKGYSLAYAESDAGVVFGKDKGARATLSASGDMLAAMDLDLPSDRNKLKVLFTDTLESEKAHGHIKGSNSLPKRDFFGLSSSDVNDLRNKFDNTVTDAIAQTLAGEDISQGGQSNLDFILEEGV